jgi:hypothetical protein
VNEALGLDPDTPMRIHVAAAICFPRGGMTTAGLRREARRGRLVIERIAGKDYTTLNHIKRMRELCRVKQDHQDFGNDRNDGTKPAALPMLPHGSSLIEVANSALELTLATLTAQTAR